MAEDKAIKLGHPSYVWRFGQERRLELIDRHAPLEGRTILDAGCGIGTYVRAFRRFSPHVHGVDLDAEKAAVVLSHEVIEHVGDDGRAVADAVRVLRSPGAGVPGGRLVIFAPNRLYPFETHGVYWRGRYHFGNVPLVNYLPDRWRNRLCPHVRVYTRRDLRRLLAGLPVKIVVHTQVFPGYDKIVRRHRRLGALLRRVTYFLESTPLRALGLSHLLVVEKTG